MCAKLLIKRYGCPSISKQFIPACVHWRISSASTFSIVPYLCKSSSKLTGFPTHITYRRKRGRIMTGHPPISSESSRYSAKVRRASSFWSGVPLSVKVIGILRPRRTRLPRMPRRPCSGNRPRAGSWARTSAMSRLSAFSACARHVAQNCARSLHVPHLLLFKKCDCVVRDSGPRQLKRMRTH